MTKRRLTLWVFTTLAVYSLCIVAGLVLKAVFPDANDPVYGAFKDLIPFLIAIPAAWLGYCFSRRLAYLQQLRTLWTQINSAVQACIQYTHLEKPPRETYGDVLTRMSTVIDEVRGAFMNIGEGSGTRGLYPFEEIKGIRRSVSDLGFGEQYNVDSAIHARREILRQWKRVQEPFLSEFDRQEPSYPSSPYITEDDA